MRRPPAFDSTGALVTAVPAWEDPIHRFLHGLGELKMMVQNPDGTLSPDGPAFTLFEALDLADLSFPIRLGNSRWTSDDLWTQAAILLQGDPWAYVDSYGTERIRELQQHLFEMGLLDPAQEELVHDRTESEPPERS